MQRACPEAWRRVARDDNAPVRSLLRSPLLRVIMSRGTKDAFARFSTRRDLLNHRCLVIVFIEAARDGEVSRFNAARGTALVTFSLTKRREGRENELRGYILMLRYD